MNQMHDKRNHCLIEGKQTNFHVCLLVKWLEVILYNLVWLLIIDTYFYVHRVGRWQLLPLPRYLVKTLRRRVDWLILNVYATMSKMWRCFMVHTWKKKNFSINLFSLWPFWPRMWHCFSSRDVEVFSLLSSFFGQHFELLKWKWKIDVSTK